MGCSPDAATAPVRHRRVMTSTPRSPIPTHKIDAVQRLYAAYGRGDMDGVLAEVADDVDWAAEAASTSVPWYGSTAARARSPGSSPRSPRTSTISEFGSSGSPPTRPTWSPPCTGRTPSTRPASGRHVHAALVAVRRRQDRLLPRLGGHRADRRGLLVDNSRSIDSLTRSGRPVTVIGRVTGFQEEKMSVLDVGLQISGFRLDDVTVIVVRGALDTEVAPSLRAAFEAWVPTTMCTSTALMSSTSTVPVWLS